MPGFKMMVHPWNNLRGHIGMFGVDQKRLALILKHGEAYVSLRMTGKKDWSMQDALTMMRVFKIPREQFLDYFGREPVEVEIEKEE